MYLTGLWHANAQNFVFVFADDGETRMGGSDDVGCDALDAVVSFNTSMRLRVIMASRTSSLGKVQYFFPAGQCVGIKNFLFVRLAQQGQYVFGGVGLPASREIRRSNLGFDCVPSILIFVL